MLKIQATQAGASETTFPSPCESSCRRCHLKSSGPKPGLQSVCVGMGPHGGAPWAHHGAHGGPVGPRVPMDFSRKTGMFTKTYSVFPKQTFLQKPCPRQRNSSCALYNTMSKRWKSRPLSQGPQKPHFLRHANRRAKRSSGLVRAETGTPGGVCCHGPP